MKIDYGYMRLAKRASLESPCYPRVGAVLSKKRPLSFGYNKWKTHPTYSNPNFTLKGTIHAEMDCLSRLEWDDLQNSTVWVYREIDGLPAIARPCDDCMKILRDSGIRRIVYTISTYPYYKIERIN